MQNHYWIVEIRTHAGSHWIPWTVHASRAAARSEREHISGHFRIRKFIAA